MDDTIINASVTSGIVSILYAMYKIFKHTKCKGFCCGIKSNCMMDLSPPPTPLITPPTETTAEV